MLCFRWSVKEYKHIGLVTSSNFWAPFATTRGFQSWNIHGKKIVLPCFPVKGIQLKPLPWLLAPPLAYHWGRVEKSKRKNNLIRGLLAWDSFLHCFINFADDICFIHHKYCLVCRDKIIFLLITTYVSSGIFDNHSPVELTIVTWLFSNCIFKLLKRVSRSRWPCSLMF